MKTSFIVKLLPIEDIDKETTIYQQIGDIALCLFILIADDGESVYTTKAPIYILKVLDISKEELIKAALENTESYYPSTVIAFDDLQTMVTCDSSLNGAVALFYPNTCYKIARTFNDSFYAIPTSCTGYSIISKRYFDYSVATKALDSIDHVNPAYKLGKCILYYDKKKDKLIVCKKEYNKDAYIF